MFELENPAPVTVPGFFFPHPARQELPAAAIHA
jgi:hypothetical protein